MTPQIIILLIIISAVTLVFIVGMICGTIKSKYKAEEAANNLRMVDFLNEMQAKGRIYKYDSSDE